ncbi:thioredoxin domain-containing protein [Candidatus Gracilibacteria bacterium]|nr:thioredoxin domain-containing protein [Candidatus Gracilibacteria bacterium]
MVVRKAQITENNEEISQSCSKSSCWHIVVTILLILSLLMNAFSLYFLTGKSLPFYGDTVGIKSALLELEYEKVGGQKNYDLISRYSQLQLKEQIPQIEQFLKSGGDQAGTQNPQPTPSTTGTMTQENITNLKKDAAIEGDANANILVIEYSDMECPFCMKQYHDNQISQKLSKQYAGKIAFAFKNNKGVNHKGTEAKAIASLCVQKISGNEKYIKYYRAIMDGSTNEGGVYDVAKLGSLAKSIGVDEKAFQSCFDTKAVNVDFVRQTAEAGKYGLTGTPGTLIVNTTTGKYDTVEGAFPYETFTQKIDALLK